RAAMRARERGTSVARVLETVATLRAETPVPVVLLTYYNPVLAFGLKAFARTAADAGADGVIVADLPLEEAGPFSAEAEAAGLDLVHLVAPTSTPGRVRLIARRSRGFIYVVSLTGFTGGRRSPPAKGMGGAAPLRRRMGGVAPLRGLWRGFDARPTGPRARRAASTSPRGCGSSATPARRSCTAPRWNARGASARSATIPFGSPRASASRSWPIPTP